MPKIKITKSAVDALAADGKRYAAWDSELKGFGVRVAPSGRKTYVVQYRNSTGRTRKLALGRVGIPQHHVALGGCELVNKALRDLGQRSLRKG